jgi:hypothetical protein
MRYVCMDRAGCHDLEVDTRAAIEEAIPLYAADATLAFLPTFTNFSGHGEKAPRLRGHSPSDQPVMYASAMLHLRRECGGDEWVRRFFAQLAKCPARRAEDEASSRHQCVAWLAAASVAARRDLTTIFCDQWRFTMSPQERARFASAAWQDPKLDVRSLL